MGKVKNFFKSVGNWFKNHVPTRRRIIQVYAALLTNANLKDFAEGHIYQNTDKITAFSKNVCTPGINCYSCPGAVAACPLGALQNSLGASDKTTPYYILGILALLGLLLARTVCGFLCPFGFFQDMLYKVKSPKVKKSAYTRLLSYLKYVLLITLVIAVPLIYHNVPGFCKYICPAGTFEGAGGLLANEVNADMYGMLGYLFSWKFVLLVICVVGCIFVYRAFCRFICPLGAIYGFFNKISLLGVKLEKSKCIDCGMCISKCKMDIRHVGDHECINCGECIPVCPTKAITWKGSQLFVEPTSVGIKGAESTIFPAPKLTSILASGTAAQTVNAGTATVETKPLSTTVAAPVEPVAGTKTEEPIAPKQSVEKPKKKGYTRKKSAKILEIVAWVVAGIVLITALIYYNTLPWSVTSSGNKLKNFKVETYATAYDDGHNEFDLYENYYKAYQTSEERKPLIAVFWDAKNTASAEYLNQWGEFYEEVQESANIVVIHVVDERVSYDDAQEAIDANGWNEYNIPFVQDTDEYKLYTENGGTGAYPFTVFFNQNIKLHSSHVGAMTLEGIKAELKEIAEQKLVFAEGDRIENFTVKAYNSSYKEGTFSTASAYGKVFILNFWYVSCGPCVEELPGIEEINKAYGDDVMVLAMHAYSTDEAHLAQKTINEFGWSDWKTIFGQDILDEDFYFKRYGGKASYPITLVIDAEGFITLIRQGKITEAELKSAIDDALAKY